MNKKGKQILYITIFLILYILSIYSYSQSNKTPFLSDLLCGTLGLGFFAFIIYEIKLLIKKNKEHSKKKITNNLEKINDINTQDHNEEIFVYPHKKKNSKQRYCKLCEEQLTENKKCNNCNRKYLNFKFSKRFLLITSITFFTLFSTSLIINTIQYIKMKNQDEDYERLTYRNTELLNELKDKSSLNVKADFFDKYIVIIPENSEYYMSYDCWNNKGRSDSFFIMNYKDAIRSGYEKYNCSIRERLGIQEYE